MTHPGFPSTPGSAPPPPRRAVGVVVSVVAAAVAVVALISVAVWNFLIAPVDRTSPTPPSNSPVTASPTPLPTFTRPPPPTTDPPPQTTQPPPPTTQPPAQLPAGASPCPVVYPPVGGFTTSAVGNNVTSCPFAEEVRRAYGVQPVRDQAVNISAYSPVTDLTYTMTCSGSGVVTCTGGNNAVVHLI